MKIIKDSLHSFITPQIKKDAERFSSPEVDYDLSFSLRSGETDEVLAYILLTPKERTCHILAIKYRKDISEEELPSAIFGKDLAQLYVEQDADHKLLMLLLQGIYDIRNADGFPLFYDLTYEGGLYLKVFGNFYGVGPYGMSLREKGPYYKAASPQDTIYRIRGILHNLGIFTTEQHFRSEGMYYSCRVVIDNDDIGHFDIGTNGKGMTAEYALASAYAELMERLENKMLIMATKYATKDFRRNNPELEKAYCASLAFRYYPDETVKEISADELWEHCQRLLPGVAKYGKAQLDGQETYRMYYADFFNAMKKETEHLPYHLIRLAASSTGLCAGNIPEEAILQGINEILERYVLQQIYLQRLTPPVVPIAEFAYTEIGERLERLQKEKGWDVEVRDCSLGKGFPVVGLLLKDKRNNRYTFRLGADLSPKIALQRCFTEIFQGADNSECYMQPMLLDEDFDVRKEHNQSVVNGTGRFPRQLFGKKGSWEFRGFRVEEHFSFQEDLLRVIRWLEKNGYTLYVRDNSFLDFPAYHLFIPGLSEIDARLYDVIADLKKNTIDGFMPKPEYRLKETDLAEKNVLIEKYRAFGQDILHLFPYCTGRENQFNRKVLLALLSYSTGKDAEAYAYMREFLREREAEGVEMENYYYCVRDMFYAKSVVDSDEEVISMLAGAYTEEMAKEALTDMSDRKNVLKNFSLPKCFHCGECNLLGKSCSYSDIIQLECKIQRAQQENKICQDRLRETFCCSQE